MITAGVLSTLSTLELTHEFTLELTLMSLCSDHSRVNWDGFVQYQKANVVYTEDGRQFSVRSMDVLMNAQCPHKLWSALKSVVFGSISDASFPLIIGGGVVWCVNRLERQIAVSLF